jgi:ankyrin repeat protein
VNASKEEEELLRMFPNRDEFKDDYELTPILVAVLHEYDPSDHERPKLADLLLLARVLNETNQGVDEDWHSWRRRYQKRSPLYREMIESYREAAIARPLERRITQDFVSMPDAIQRWTPVLWAAFAGRTEELQVLLEYGADRSVVSSSGRNALHHAAESKNPETMELLLDTENRDEGRRQLDINLADSWRETPLHVAASKSAACVSLLLKNGADVNALQGDGQVPLHYTKLVKVREKYKIVDILSAEQGVKLNVKDDGGRTPLFCMLDDPGCVNLLLDRGARVGVLDDQGKTVLHHACLEDQPETLKTLLDRSPDVLAIREDSSGSTPLLDAFQRGSVSCVRILLERKLWGRFEDNDGWTLVHHAAKMRDDDALELALKHPDAHPHLRNRQGQSVMDVALEAGQLSDRARALLSVPQRHQRYSDREHMDATIAHLEARR